MRNTNIYTVSGGDLLITTKSGKQIIVDTDAIELLREFTWCVGGTGYAMSRTKGSAVLMHRLLTGAKSGEYVDHINGNTLDNRKSNLRICRKQQNEFNTKRRSDNRSGFRGVCAARRGKFRAYINKDGKQYHLGEFSDPVEAAKAYNAKAVEFFGEFARLNPI